MLLLHVICWVAIGLCVYVYAGYPALLWLVARLVGRPPLKAEVTPTVSLLIAAHDEERQLSRKIENSLELDYPEDRREIIVASDGSTDATEEIAGRFESEGVVLLSLARCGKMRALNEAAAQATGEILVFTDANALLERQALKRLVAPFADPDVGGVCGNQKFGFPSARADSSAEGEDLYWRYDKYLKMLETEVGSTIAADGSLHALRRDLYTAIGDGAQADDFAVSARVVTLGGRRLVYEPAAISFEAPPAASEVEFQRKVRVANHGMRAILNLKGGLNPLRTGFYAVELWSHKVLRYIFPLFAAVALITSALLAPGSALYQLLLLGQLLFYALAVAGAALRRTDLGRLTLLYAPFYFCLANAALLVGMISLLKGRRINEWQPQRETSQLQGTQT